MPARRCVGCASRRTRAYPLNAKVLFWALLFANFDLAFATTQTSRKPTVRNVVSLLYVFLVAPIWYYLLYQILVRVGASELMFFLFWVYVPAGILVQLVTQAIARADK